MLLENSLSQFVGIYFLEHQSGIAARQHMLLLQQVTKQSIPTLGTKRHAPNVTDWVEFERIYCQIKL